MLSFGILFLDAQRTFYSFESIVLGNSDASLFTFCRDKKQIAARAYLNFTTPEAVQQFWQEFNGHTFITSRGKEMKTIVDYAPFQKTPKQKKKPNSKENTIETGTITLNLVAL